MNCVRHRTRIASRTWLACLLASLSMLAVSSVALAQQSHTNCPDPPDIESEGSPTGDPDCGQVQAGNPINVHSLNLLRQVTDLEADANGRLRLNMVRSYNSRVDLHSISISRYSTSDTSFAVFGPAGWTHSFNWHLYDRGYLVLMEPDGTTDFFEENPLRLTDPGADSIHQRVKSSSRDTIIEETSLFTLYQENGWRVVFDLELNPGSTTPHFVPTSIFDPAGNELSLEYHTEPAVLATDPLHGRLKKVSDAAGRSLTFGYNEGVFVFEPTGGGGGTNVWDLTVPELQTLAAGGGGGPGGTLRSPDPAILSSVTDSAGRKVSYEYIQRGTIKIVDVEPLLLHQATIESPTEAPVLVSRYSYSQDFTPNALDNDFRLLTAEDRNGPPDHPAVRYGYPAEIRGVPIEFHNPASPTHQSAIGAITREENLDTGDLIVDIGWPADDPNGAGPPLEMRVISRPANDPLGANTVTLTLVEGDAQNPPVTAPVAQKTVYYLRPGDKDSQGNDLPHGVSFPNNNMPVKVVDFEGHQTELGYAEFVEGPLGPTQPAYSTRQLTSQEDRLGRTTTQEFGDSVGETGKSPLTSRTYPDGSSDSWAYFAHAETFIPEWLVQSETDQLGRTTSYEYFSGSGSATNPATDLVTKKTYEDLTTEIWAYDLQAPTSNDQGLVTSYTDRNGHLTTYTHTFDAAGWLQSTLTVDAVGREMITTYDILGRVTQQKEPGNRITSYEYNLHSDVTKRTLPDGSEIVTEYDQLVGATFDAARDNYYLDPAPEFLIHRGNVTKTIEQDVTDPSAPPVVVREYAYDAFNRLIAQRLVTVAGLEVTQFSYAVDAYLAPPGQSGCGGGCGGGVAGGIVRQMTGPEGQTTDYFYDEENRLIMTALPDPDGAGPLARPMELRDYDEEGQLIQIIDSEGAETEFT